MTPRLTVILEREEEKPGSGNLGVSRINRQIFHRKLRSDIVHEQKVAESHHADTEVTSNFMVHPQPQPISRHDVDTDAESSRSSSPFASNPPTPPSKTMRIPSHHDHDHVHVRSGHSASGPERRRGFRFSSEPPPKIPEHITFSGPSMITKDSALQQPRRPSPAPSTTAKDGALQPLRRPFKDKETEGCTTWYVGSSNSPIAQPPSTFGVYGDLYLHSIRGTNGPPIIWLMDDHSTWERVQEGCTHPYITDRCLRIRGSGEPSWVLKASLATMRHRKERVTRS